MTTSNKKGSRILLLGVAILLITSNSLQGVQAAVDETAAAIAAGQAAEQALVKIPTPVNQQPQVGTDADPRLEDTRAPLIRIPIVDGALVEGILSKVTKDGQVVPPPRFEMDHQVPPPPPPSPPLPPTSSDPSPASHNAVNLLPLPPTERSEDATGETALDVSGGHHGESRILAVDAPSVEATVDVAGKGSEQQGSLSETDPVMAKTAVMSQGQEDAFLLSAIVEAMEEEEKKEREIDSAGEGMPPLQQEQQQQRQGIQGGEGVDEEENEDAIYRETPLQSEWAVQGMSGADARATVGSTIEALVKISSSSPSSSVDPSVQDKVEATMEDTSSRDEGGEVTLLDQDGLSPEDRAIVEEMAAALLDQYKAEADAELTRFKKDQAQQEQEQQQQQVDATMDPIVVAAIAETTPPLVHIRSDSDVDNGIKTEEQEAERVEVTLNRLNKNMDDEVAFSEAILANTMDPQVQADKGNDQQQGKEQEKRQEQEVKVIPLAGHHHHHISSRHGDGSDEMLLHKKKSFLHTKKQGDGTIRIMAETGEDADDENVAIPEDGELDKGEKVEEGTELDSDEDEENSEALDDTSTTGASQPPAPAAAAPPAPAPLTVIPDSILHRGLAANVQGARHCTPQFCVNVSLSDDAQFATFHIERDLAETGWISLGIGYAMTMADLIILWPNPSAEVPRGAVLSRRTSHAYVEPRMVGGPGAGADGPMEKSLYPPNEYILHNLPVSGAPVTASVPVEGTVLADPKKFIVQFTRPVKTLNRAHKLTPGQEQDFCWAYSPKPISTDSVSDPGAHIAQHLSVGSFAMDVAANQPQLKDALARQKLVDQKEEAEEKIKKAKELEESNRRLAEGEKDATHGGQKKSKHHPHHGGAGKVSAGMRGWMGYGGEGGIWAFPLALQGVSCLVVLTLMWFFR